MLEVTIGCLSSIEFKTKVSASGLITVLGDNAISLEVCGGGGGTTDFESRAAIAHWSFCPVIVLQKLIMVQR